MSSDYTPPAVVTPTPGGAAGDGSLNGALTLRANVASGSAGAKNASLILAWSNGSEYLYTDSAGNLYIGNPAAGLGTTISMDGDGAGVQLRPSGYVYNFQSSGLTSFSNVSTSGKGVAPIFGLDNRTALTAADGSAKTLYTTTASGQLYRLSGRILATAGTSPSATYTLKWTERGTVQTETLTLSALNTIEAVSVLIQPDSGTAITAQLTAISGTITTVNVAATVEEMA